MKRAACALLILMMAGAALAQDATPTVETTAEATSEPTVIGAAVTPEATDEPTVIGAVLAQIGTPAPPQQVTLDANDARTAVCSAPTLPDFVPYVVRPGDRLAGLIAGQSTITVTQLAVLNCLDDPDALIVGAVIWLPAPPSAVEATAEVTAAPGVTPEAAPAATAEGTAEPGQAVIEQFSASAESVVNTDSVTFRWSAQGSSAYFYHCPVETCIRPQTAVALPLAASISFTGYQYAGTYRYRLDVDGSDGAVTQDVSLEVACAQEWLGGVGASPLCPEAPARTVFAVWQPFEKGVLIWFSDVQQIFVMTNDGVLRVYADAYVEGQPDPSAAPPAGLFAPRRGFGLLWQGLGGANSPLGWATAPEVGYDGARQAAGHSSYTTYIAGPERIVYAVTQLPGAETGYWAQVGE